MRHGDAEPEVHNNDAKRVLTSSGQQQVCRVITQIAPQIRDTIQHVIVSPYVRAQQTWNAIAHFFPQVQQVETSADVAPDGPYAQVADYLDVLVHYKEGSSVLVVSHLPHVDFLSSELCPSRAPVIFTPASVAIIEKKDGENQFIQLIQG